MAFENVSLSTDRIPQISDTGKGYQPVDPTLTVHERLHRHALTKQQDQHNTLLDLLQTKLNLPLKPWEVARTMSPGGLDPGEGHYHSNTEGQHAYVKLYNKTHLPKPSLQDTVEQLVIQQEEEEEEEYHENSHSHSHSHSGYGHHNNRESNRDREGNRESMKIGNQIVTVIEFDDTAHTVLWKQLRTII